MFDMVAILGRGIQRLSAGGSWALTENLELCDTNSAHLPVRAPIDDTSPYCMIGGGEMNLRAGLELIRQHKPKIVVCAYGGRSEYLESINGPSESEVMSEMLYLKMADDPHFMDRWGGPDVRVWPRTRQLPVPSNTRQELLNIFDLALEHDSIFMQNFPNVAIVTVGVHVPRTATYVAKHLSTNPKYQSLCPVVFESEEVLLAVDRNKFAPEVEAMRNSKSFARNWEREATGISKIVRDVYGDAKPKVVAV